MSEIFVIAVIIAIAYYFLSRDSLEVRERGSGRGEFEKDALRYFFNDGIFQRKVTDTQYDSMLSVKLSRVNSLEHALSKVGVDESEVCEVDPVHFEGYLYDGYTRKRGVDGRWRSTGYQTSRLFFSAEQVYLFSCTFNMTREDMSELTEEYFYKDITNFSTLSGTSESIDASTGARVLESHDSFVLSYPGGKFTCSMSGDPSSRSTTERTVQGLKSLLREKKGQK
jgi:hypothetical protein